MAATRESAVLRALADRYSLTRAARTGKAVRDLLIDYEELLKMAGCATGEARVCAVRDLAEMDGGLLVIERHKRTRLPLDVRFSPSNETLLFARLGISAPGQQREALASCFHSALQAPVSDRWEQGWKAFCNSYEAAAVEGTSLQPFDREKVDEIKEILELLPRLLAWQRDSLMRFASSLLCRDSKRLEQLQRKLETCLERITCSEWKTLADMGITQNERSLLLHGPLNLGIDGTWVDLGVFAGPVRIDRRDLERAVFDAKPGRCLTVENPAMLHELCKLRSGTILASSGSEGGFAHSAIITFLAKLPPAIECWHFGDSDPKGFDILRDLRERSGRKINSLHMQFREQKNAVPLSREDAATIERLLVSEFLTAEEKSELRKIRDSGTKGLFEQESLGLPAGGWPFFLMPDSHN